MALTVERKVCPRCGRTFRGGPHDKLCGICSAVAPAGAYQDNNEINQRNAVRDYVRAHPGAPDSEIINNLGISKQTLHRIAKSAKPFKNGIYHPCGRCGKNILEGIYCSDCRALFMNEVKLNSERNNYKKRIIQEEQLAIKANNVILVVDADDLNLNTTKHILEMGIQNFRISTTNNQTRAINTLHQLKTRLLLLDDAVLPSYDGMSILRSVREDNLCKNVKIMMTTAQSKMENISRGLLMGALDYVNKPFDPKNLIDRVNKVLMAEAVEFTSRMVFKILLIDDKPEDMELEKELLSSNFSCDVLTASSGIEGVWMLDINEVDLVMVSLEMSFMDGLNSLAFIRKSPNLKGLPVIIMTNSNDPALINSVTSSSVRGYIRKPFFDDSGLMLIKNALDAGKYWR